PQRASAARNASRISGFMALRASGRLSTIHPTPSSTVKSSVSLTIRLPPVMSSCDAAVPAGRHAELRTEGADEVRQVLEADVEGDLGDGGPGGDETVRGLTQTRAQDPLMRCDAGQRLEGTQEMIAAEPGATREVCERLRILETRFQLTQRPGDAAGVSRSPLGSISSSAGRQLYGGAGELEG